MRKTTCLVSLLICAIPTIVAPVGLYCQKLEIVTSKQPTSASGGSGGITLLLVAAALAVGAFAAWFLRGRFVESTEYNYNSSAARPRRLARRKRNGQKHSGPDVQKESEEVMSQLNQIVKGAMNDPRNLPIFSFRSVPQPLPLEELEEIDDPEIDLAVDHSNEELQPDPDLRRDAVEALGMYRTPRSVDALSQVAIYDPETSLRSLAVATLSSFDHGSIFQAIVVACSDPSREVRAAASRALFKVTFPRADEWFRIVASADTFVARQCARAAIVAGLHTATFSRLVNRERNAVLEAFAIVCVLIRAGEIEELIDAVMNHPDVNVSLALLHIIEVNGDETTGRELAIAAETFETKPEIRQKITQTIGALATASSRHGNSADMSAHNSAHDPIQVQTSAVN